MKSTLLKSTERMAPLPLEIMAELDGSGGVGTGALTPAEQVKLERLEREVNENMLGYVKAGMAILTIRELRLYRGTHERFEDYLAERFEMARSRAYQLIDGATVYQNLHNCGHALLPCNEAQARPLAKLPADDQPLVWNRVVEEAPNGHITGKIVQQVVRTHLGLEQNKRARQKRDEAKADPALPQNVQDALAAMVDLAQVAKEKPYRDAFVKHLQGMIEILKG